MTARDPSRPAFRFAFAALVAVRLALTAPLPVEERFFPFDDALYVRTADALLRGEWLGAYDQRTFAKAPGYAFQLAAARFFGVPRRFADDALYAAGVLLLAIGLRRAGVGRAAVLLAGTGALFSPAFMGATASTVIREQCVGALVLGLLGAALCALVGGRLSTRFAWACLHGFILTWLWFVREESVWLLAPLSVSAAALLVAERRRRGAWRPALLATLLLAAPSVGGVLGGRAALRAANAAVYGAPITIESDDPDVAAAVGAVTRLASTTERYSPVPQASIRALYPHSPALASLSKKLDSDAFRFPGAATEAGDVQAAWWPFLIRDAVRDAGEYRDLRSTKAFYRRLADEVNAACDRGVAPAAPRRAGFTPSFRAELLPETARAAISHVADLWRLGIAPAVHGPRSGPPPDPETAAQFARTLGAPESAPIDVTTAARIDALSAVQIAWGRILPWVAAIAAAAVALRLLLLLRVPAGIELFVVGWSAAAVSAMAALLAFVQTHWWQTTTDYQLRVYALLPVVGCVAAADAVAAFVRALPTAASARLLQPWPRRAASAALLAAAAYGGSRELAFANDRLVDYGAKGIPVFAYRAIDAAVPPARPIVRLVGGAGFGDDRGDGFAAVLPNSDAEIVFRLQALGPAAVDTLFEIEVDEPAPDLRLRLRWKRDFAESAPIAGEALLPVEGAGPRRYRFQTSPTPPLVELRLSVLEASSAASLPPTPDRSPVRLIVRRLGFAPP